MPSFSPRQTPIDDLFRLSALPAAQVASVLLDLVLEGVVVRHAGARVPLWGEGLGNLQPACSLADH